ncbi:WxL protein peptidoglycan domain-containing protein [Apilactobacillus micheneri]|uniref:WxL protein peptidoglycan domain-containing protein n=1 Tax=Apilactobacillus micheneri TaxID=1899430 RepID=UPI0015E84D1E|nr:DUF916 domain-containing protein [Apilactobacillus micheneri]
MTKSWFVKINIIIFIIFFCILSFSIGIYAKQKNNVSVRPMLSGLPIIKNSRYFNLSVEPNKHYNISLLVTNNTNKQLFFRSIIKNASTADNGNIVYNNLSHNNDMLLSGLVGKNLKFNTLKPFTQKVIRYNFYTKSNLFYGSKLGAVITTFYDVGNKKSIKNEVSYINGISLNEINLEPNLQKLSIGNYFYSDQNHGYMIQIKNPNSILYRHLQLDLKTNNDILKKSFSDINIAPRSSFFLILPSNNKNVLLKNISVIVNHKLNLNKKFNGNSFIRYKFLIFFISISIFLILLMTVRR